MAVFVLVHGAYHGGWCWSRVAPMLREQGHEVFTPSLSGMGEHVHRQDEGIGLDTHIADILALLRWYDLRDVILVAHSYGSCVTMGAAEQVAERIARLVHLDGIVPAHGQSVADCLGEDLVPVFDEAMSRGPKKWGDDVPSADLFGVKDPKDMEWMHERLTPQPVRTLVDKLSMPSNKANMLPRTYIYCVKESPISRHEFYANFKNDPTWQMMVLDAVHDAMITDPGAVADALLSIIDERK